MIGLPGILPHHRYDRQEIAGLLSAKYSRYWQQGVVRVDSDFLLFVTLDKTGKPPEFQYADRFLSATEFQWQSQNQESRAKRGAKYQNRGVVDLRFHLFVRRRAKDDNNNTAKFAYLGRVRFHSWEGDNPINIRWALDIPVPSNLLSELDLPEG